MLTLHNLSKSKSKAGVQKRRGRGNASGRGNYSTRGMKGQRSRSGGKSGLALRSIKGYLLRIPKVRGFKSIHAKMSTVNIKDLDSRFHEGDTINARSMLKAGLITTTAHGVKVLSVGKLSKKITVEANAFSKAAQEKITKAGGKIVVVSSAKLVEPKAKDAEGLEPSREKKIKKEDKK